MSTYVVVHTRSQGGWVWHKVADLLRARGHTVYANSLTGLADRRHLLNRQVGLETHIQDVVGVLKYEGIRGGILVGHAAAGSVIAGAADRARERVDQLVYLEGVIVEDGKCIFDYYRPDERAAWEHTIATEGQGWKIPLSVEAGMDQSAFRLTAPEDVLAWRSRKTPHPARAFMEPLRLSPGRSDEIKRSYIRCVGWPGGILPQFYAQVEANRSWTYREIDTGHAPALTAPGAVAMTLESFG